MTGMVVHRQMLEEWLTAMREGRPIEPLDGRWDYHDLIALAGAAMAQAEFQGSWDERTEAIMGPSLKPPVLPHSEYAEADREMSIREARAAAAAASWPAEVLLKGYWGDFFDGDQVGAKVSISHKPGMAEVNRIEPVFGWKDRG
ncbi:MAG: hypothetical protein AB7S38_18355 [Vulcanimicrobiota bacterium]